MKSIFELTPRQIVHELDQYVIGQDDAKKAVAIALRNRWRRNRIDEDIRDEIMPNNILMIGSTGVGKTEIARRLARLSGAPFVKVEASKYTEVGYVGRDVEGIIRDLMEVAVSNIRSEMTGDLEGQTEELVENRLLDLLVPLPKRKSVRKDPPKPPEALQKLIESGDLTTFVIEDEESEEEAQVDRNAELDERYQRTREKFRKRLHDRKLEDALVEIDQPERVGGVMQVFGAAGMEEMGINLQEMMGGLFPRKSKKRKVTIAEARKLLMAEELEKQLDMDAIISEAVFRCEHHGIVFLDEIDKIGSSEGGNGPDVSREGVQRDILPIIEGTRVMTKYGPINTEHILFIAAGAFHMTRPSDLIPELQGRFPIRVEMDSLGKKEFVKILKEPKNSLVKQYVALFDAEGVSLTFEAAALREIAGFAEEFNDRMEDIGARRLHSVMTSLLEDYMFKMPAKTIKNVKVDRKFVKDQLGNLIEDDDVDRYIL